ncbi:MAG: TPM domain-containing protein [Vicinamibacterales bacterium]
MRRCPNLLIVLLLSLTGILNASPGSAQELPTHVGKVNDFASVLSASDRDALEARLGELERATSAEVAVVTIPNLNMRSIEEYANELFNRWGIGKAGKDNGVLVLVAVQEHTMRIEVGYGLEGVLPDGLAGAVIRESFLPRFRKGDYPAGILEGTARVIDIVRRNETLTPEQRAALDAAAQEARKSWGMAVFLGIFVAIGAFVSGTGAGARVIVQTLFGALFMAVGIGATTAVAPFSAVVVQAVVTLAIFAWSVSLGRRPAWQKDIRGNRGGGWMFSGAGSSSSSSGRSSSSGSSFGGGRSGGGGASGSW